MGTLLIFILGEIVGAIALVVLCVWLAQLKLDDVRKAVGDPTGEAATLSRFAVQGMDPVWPADRREFAHEA